MPPLTVVQQSYLLQLSAESQQYAEKHFVYLYDFVSRSIIDYSYTCTCLLFTVPLSIIRTIVLQIDYQLQASSQCYLSSHIKVHATSLYRQDHESKSIAKCFNSLQKPYPNQCNPKILHSNGVQYRYLKISFRYICVHDKYLRHTEQLILSTSPRLKSNQFTKNNEPF